MQGKGQQDASEHLQNGLGLGCKQNLEGYSVGAIAWLKRRARTFSSDYRRANSKAID